MDILVAISSIIGVGFPITIYLLSKKNKASKAKGLLELLEHRIKLNNYLKKEEHFDDIPIVYEKLNDLIREIDYSLNKKSNKVYKFNIWPFLTFVSIEILIVFNMLSDLVLQNAANKKAENTETADIFEGIFNTPQSRIILILAICLISFLLSFRLINWISSKQSKQNNLKVNFYLILSFNLIIMIQIAIMMFLDEYTNWF